MSTDPRDWTDRGTQRFLDTVDTSFYGVDYGTPAAALEACKRLMRDSSGVRESATLTERYHELVAAVEFIAEPRTVAELQHNHGLAETMHGVCPLCGGAGKVRAQHLQATRQRPCQFLGVQGWCVPCQMPFEVEHAQLVLS